MDAQFGRGFLAGVLQELRRLEAPPPVSLLKHSPTGPPTKDWLYRIFSISGLMRAGVAAGAKRATTLPVRSTRNLVKFHLIFLVPSRPG
jgi:hypothetical protein